MQPSPTSSLLAGSAPRLRAWTLSLHVALFAILLALGACGDPKVTAYHVPKEDAVSRGTDARAVDGSAAATPQSGSSAAPSGVAVDSEAAGNPTLPAGHPSIGEAPASADAAALPTAAGSDLAWTVPATWAAQPAGMMRKATYRIVGIGGATAELAISAFPGDVGGEVANVNRWRGQVGLDPLPDSQATASIERLESHGLKIGVLDVVAPSTASPVHMLAAMVPFDGATWFFKLLGPDAVVGAQKGAFVEFLKTIRPATPAKP